MLLALENALLLVSRGLAARPHDSTAALSMSVSRFAGIWLVAAAAGSILAALVRGSFDTLAFPLLLGLTGIVLLNRTGQASPRFPGTDLERGLDRLLALLLPVGRVTTNAVTRAAVVAQRIRLAQLRRAARLWRGELERITTDGYETASRISARRASAGRLDDSALVTEAVRVLREERASAGADLGLAGDPVSVLAYGLGARPAGADLSSLEELLDDLGLPGEGDELRAHFDEVVTSESASSALRLRNEAQRSMFRDLAGASFVLGAAVRILELASFTGAQDLPAAAAARAS